MKTLLLWAFLWIVPTADNSAQVPFFVVASDKQTCEAMRQAMTTGVTKPCLLIQVSRPDNT